MPDRDVKTVRDLIYFQYAKIITRSAFGLSDGREAKGTYYGFIKKKFRELRSGVLAWSDIAREDWQLVESDKHCVYCGATGDLQRDHIVPKSTSIKPECSTCDRIHGIHNQVWACSKCNLMKHDKGLYTFYRSRLPEEKKFFDFIPTLVEKKYLKTVFYCHQCADTLDAPDVNGDGEIGVLDIDCIFKPDKP